MYIYLNNNKIYCIYIMYIYLVFFTQILRYGFFFFLIGENSSIIMVRYFTQLEKKQHTDKGT